MQVRDLMTTDVVTVPVDATLADAVRRFLDADVGSVVGVDTDGDPVAILTESDALRAALDRGAPLTEVPVSAVAHSPVVTTTPGTAVPSVARQMSAEDVKKVPVLDELELVGIITLTDIVWHLS